MLPEMTEKESERPTPFSESPPYMCVIGAMWQIGVFTMKPCTPKSGLLLEFIAYIDLIRSKSGRDLDPKSGPDQVREEGFGVSEGEG